MLGDGPRSKWLRIKGCINHDDHDRTGSSAQAPIVATRNNDSDSTEGQPGVIKSSRPEVYVLEGVLRLTGKCALMLPHV